MAARGAAAGMAARAAAPAAPAGPAGAVVAAAAAGWATATAAGGLAAAGMALTTTMLPWDAAQLDAPHDGPGAPPQLRLASHHPPIHPIHPPHPPASLMSWVRASTAPPTADRHCRKVLLGDRERDDSAILLKLRRTVHPSHMTCNASPTLSFDSRGAVRQLRKVCDAPCTLHT